VGLFCDGPAGQELIRSPRKMKKDHRFYADLQRYIAVTSVGPSALRNQGAPGVVKAAQHHLARLDLGRFRAKSEVDFLRRLDRETERLRKTLPRGAQHWGSARKALNIFLRDICYNRFLSQKHGLAHAEDWMEMPLDSFVARALKRKGKRRQLPRWPGLIRLTPETSATFQAFARKTAAREGISRIHLDMRAWTEERR